MTQSIVLGGGCFWCLEAGYQQVRGVTSVVSGYAGGQWPNPTYERVCSGTTGHAEVVKIEFDSAVVALKQLLDVFWTIHDPTTPNRQGYDVGSQYRSLILYTSEEQKSVIEQSCDEAQKVWTDPIVTEVKPLDHFWPAEEEQQNFFNKHPSSAYCTIVINPKLTKLREKRAELLKDA